MNRIFTQRFLLIAVILGIIDGNAHAQSLPALDLVSFSSGYSNPLDIASCGDSRLFIVEQRGKIFVCDSTGVKKSKPFLDISNKVNQKASGAGLMGITFHPDYATNGYFYVHYVSKKNHIKISRFKVKANNPNRADSLSELVLINFEEANVNHNGGCLKFGNDGYLYISLGDGNEGGDSLNNAQNPGVFSGKLLRIDVNKGTTYKSPKDNPFHDSTGYKKQIWALGLRNPWRFSFDRLTHDLWMGDDGESSWEEVDMQPSSSDGGENYGWRCYEGNHEFNTTGCGPSSKYTFPLIEYPHANGDCSVIGGYVYRGTQFPGMYGKYIYNDFCSGKFKTIFNDGSQWKDTVLTDRDDFSFVGFGENQKGELYTINKTTGTIYHLVDDNGFQKQDSYSGNQDLHLYPNPNHGNFRVEYFSGNSEECKVTVIDVFGREVWNKIIPVQQGWNKIEAPQLSSGVYFLTVQSSKGYSAAKVEVQ